MLNLVPSPLLRILAAAVSLATLTAALFGCYWLGYEHGLHDSWHGPGQTWPENKLFFHESDEVRRQQAR